MNSEFISHSARLMQPHETFVGEYDSTYEVMSEEPFVDNGRCLRRSVVKTVDNKEIMSQYSPDDFRIENLVAVGAFKDGKRYTYNPTTLEAYDTLDSALEVIEDIYDAQNNAVNNEQ